MTMKKISAELIKAAKGEMPVDLILRNGRVIDVFSGSIFERDIAVWGSFIVGFGDGYEAREVVDVEGKFIAPGFIDGHVHIESSMVEIPQFARAVVPRGTTSVVCDPHEIANVMGYDGIRYILESSKYNPLNVFIMLPSCVPATSLETSGSELRAFDLYPYFSEKWVLGLGEVMNYPGLLAGDPELLDKLKITHHKRVDGHAPGVTGRDLYAYSSAGISSDHECTTVDEVLEKISCGLHIMIREGTAAKNLHTLLPAVNQHNSHRCMFVTDDRHPSDLVREGHMDHVIREAISEGLNPMTAIQMATINTARYFMLNEHGAIAPGYFADLVVFDSLEDLQVRMTIKNGRIVARDGEPIWKPVERPRMTLRGSVNIRWLDGDEFKIPAESSRARVIEVQEGSLLTGSSVADMRVEGGLALADPAHDILKLVVIERHRASGRVGKAFARGFGLQDGALATTVAHDSHNIIVVGTNDEDMLASVIHLNRIGGGMVVAKEGRVIGDLPLPVAGLMSQESLEKVNKQLESLIAFSHLMGVRLPDPFMTLSFLALPVIPHLKLTDQGLVDVDAFQHVELFVE